MTVVHTVHQVLLAIPQMATLTLPLALDPDTRACITVAN